MLGISELGRNSVIAAVTDQCNTDCRHCFQSCALGSPDPRHLNIVHLLELLRHMARQPGLRTLHITGGEPFCHPRVFDLIRDALGLGYRIRLQTNGLGLSRFKGDQISYLRNPRVVIKISLDGACPSIHERLRAHGTFAASVRSIEFLRAINIRVGIKSVIHKDNLEHLENILELCVQLDAESFTYSLLRPEGQAAQFYTLCVTEAQLLEKFLPLFFRPKYRNLLKGTNILRLIKAKDRSIRETVPVFVDCTGEVYLNHVQDPTRRIGNIDSPTTRDKVLGRPCQHVSVGAPCPRPSSIQSLIRVATT